MANASQNVECYILSFYSSSRNVYPYSITGFSGDALALGTRRIVQKQTTQTVIAYYLHVP